MLKISFSFLFVSISLLYSGEFETQTPDPMIQEKNSEFLNNKNQIKSNKFVQEDALYKPDPLLETVEDKKEEKASLLEKILLQTDNKDIDEQKDKKIKKVFNKPLNQGNELITPDPLLDEI